MMIRLVIGLILGWLGGRKWQEKQRVYCRDCAKRAHCQICEQCLGDDGFCSLGVEAE